MIQETLVLLIYLKQQYGNEKQLIVPVGCVKTTVFASLMFRVNCTRQFLQVFFITFCRNKITVLIAIHWKVACEIIKNKIGESPIDKSRTLYKKE